MIRELIQQVAQLFTWIIVVAPWEQAIRVRLGKHVRHLKEGAYLRVPFIDRVYRQSVRTRRCIIAPQTLTTKDGKAVTVGASIGYAIRDLLLLYETLHDAEDSIESEAAGAIAAFVGASTLDTCTPELIEAHVCANLDLARYGLSEPECFVTNFACVRTLRLITGEIKAWQRGRGLDTSSHDQETGG